MVSVVEFVGHLGYAHASAGQGGHRPRQLSIVFGLGRLMRRHRYHRPSFERSNPRFSLAEQQHSGAVLARQRIGIRRRSRERRSPVSEIVTDTPTICQRDTGQRGRSAMDTPRHEGTPYLIEVTSRPGKYELRSDGRNSKLKHSRNHYGARRKSGYSGKPN